MLRCVQQMSRQLHPAGQLIADPSGHVCDPLVPCAGGPGCGAGHHGPQHGHYRLPGQPADDQPVWGAGATFPAGKLYHIDDKPVWGAGATFPAGKLCHIDDKPVWGAGATFPAGELYCKHD